MGEKDRNVSIVHAIYSGLILPIIESHELFEVYGECHPIIIKEHNGTLRRCIRRTEQEVTQLICTGEDTVLACQADCSQQRKPDYQTTCVTHQSRSHLTPYVSQDKTALI